MTSFPIASASDGSVEFSGKKYAEYCRLVRRGGGLTRLEALDAGRCVGVVEAMMSQSRMYGICLPAQVTVKEVIDAFIAFAEARPAQQNLGADFLILAALDLAWPCPKP